MRSAGGRLSPKKQNGHWSEKAVVTRMAVAIRIGVLGLFKRPVKSPYLVSYSQSLLSKTANLVRIFYALELIFRQIRRR
jgi:hypothetical protein